MGSLFSSGPKAPQLPMPPPAAHPATLADAAIQTAGAQTKAAGALANSTIKTSPQGLEAPTTAKTLLGQ